MAEPLDYAREKLYVNGIRVTSLTMTGLLAERVPVIARQRRVAASGVSVAHLPAFLEVSLDGVPRPQRVSCLDKDRTLAVDVAREVRARICGGKLGLDMVDAKVPVYGERKRKLGEHDMVLELVSDGKAGLPQKLNGFLSMELKLRKLWGSEEDRKKVRGKIRNENCDMEGHWWHREKETFAGRMIVVALFPDRDEKSTRIELRADLKLNAQCWRALFGWPDAVTTDETIVPTTRVAAKAAAVPKAKAAVVPNAKALAIPTAKAKAKAAAGPIATGEALLNKLVFKDGVTEVKSLLIVAEKDGTNARYWALTALDNCWTHRDVYQQEQRLYRSSHSSMKRQKLGGSGPYVASRSACIWLLKRWHKY
jgi:hypothetical protein